VGNAPLLTAKEYVVPEGVALMVCEYAVLAVAFGRLAGESVMAGQRMTSE
jgi:hypothetical protein